MLEKEPKKRINSKNVLNELSVGKLRNFRALQLCLNFIFELKSLSSKMVLVPNADPFLNKTIDRYYVEKKLGHGVFGTVYLVIDIDNKKTKAIKMIKGNNKPADLILKDVYHTNLVAYFGHFIVNPGPSCLTCIVTEFCEVSI